MTERQIPRRKVIGAAVGLGAGFVSGVSHAQAQGQPQIKASAKGKIGFLSSMPKADFDSLGLMDAFNAGLVATTGSTVAVDTSSSADVVITRQFAAGDYGSLGTLVAPWFTGTTSQDLVVSTGGVVSIAAAVGKRADANATTIPILYLTGRDPVTDNLHTAANAQGLNLDTTNLITDGIPTLMHDLLQKSAKSYLFSNSKSKVSATEQGVWDNRKKWGHHEADNSNTQQGFTAALTDATMTNKHDALIVSADPFFTSQRKMLVKTVGAQLPVCYPFREYVDAGGLISYGPNLRSAYRWLGMWAGLVLKDAGNINSLPPYTASHELVINVNDGHKSLGIFPIPDALLQRATDIVNVPIPA